MFTIINPTEVEQRLKQLIAKHKAKNISVAEIERRIFETGDENVMQESNLFHAPTILLTSAKCFHLISKPFTHLPSIV